MEDKPSNFYLERKQFIANIHIDTLIFYYLLSLLIVEIYLWRIIEQGIQLSHTPVIFRVLYIPFSHSLLTQRVEFRFMKSKTVEQNLSKQQ